MPQVAATVAAAMVGYDTFNAAGDRFLVEEIFNANLVLLVVTSLLGLGPDGIVYARNDHRGGTHEESDGLRGPAIWSNAP